MKLNKLLVKATINYFVLDVKEAFDNVPSGAPVDGLKSHHVPNHNVNWFSHYTRNRMCI